MLIIFALAGLNEYKRTPAKNPPWWAVVDCGWRQLIPAYSPRKTVFFTASKNLLDAHSALDRLRLLESDTLLLSVLFSLGDYCYEADIFEAQYSKYDSGLD